jgi:hypothetical protein
MFKDFLNSKLTGEVIDSATGLKRMPKSQAKYVEFGYGQVEPNHLSAQRTGQIYAQLPAAPAIEILEQGQFVKYDYAANDNGIGEVNFTGKGEWMLVYNEIKLYRTHIDGTKQWDCEFALLKDDFQARIYSPYDYEQPEIEYHNGMSLNGVDEKGNKTITVNTTVTLDVEGKSVTIDGTRYAVAETDGVKKFSYNGAEYELDENGESKTPVPVVYTYDDVTRDIEDIYELNYTNDPWKKLGLYREKKMPAGTSMVPRVFKTNIGDIMTTNTINETELAVGDTLTPGADGILAKAGADGAGVMVWQVVKVYDMPDGQKAVKVMRIQ